MFVLIVLGAFIVAAAKQAHFYRTRRTKQYLLLVNLYVAYDCGKHITESADL